MSEQYEDATFHGDDFWSQFEQITPDEVEFATGRISPVLQAEVMKRVFSAGAFFMRAIGDAVNAGRDSLDVYGLLVEGDDQTFSGFCMRVQSELWETLAFLAAPADCKAAHAEGSAFFRQVCGAFADAMDSYDQKIEDAPMLLGRKDPDTGEVQWHGWAPWMGDERDQMRWYSDAGEWWREIWEDDDR